MALIVVYVAFVVKHLLGDYVFQTSWMAAGKSARDGWIKPLSVHAAIHAVMTLIIVMIFAPLLWWLALVDYLIHFAVDRTKGVLTREYIPSEQRFWNSFGVDQAAHQLTHFAFVLAIVWA